MVVLEKLDIIERLVVLLIVYYVFCGVCFYWIIIVEDKKFMFSGNWSKLDYVVFKYDIYFLDIVVDCVWKRIKE